ncbi:MAG TPA: glycosyl hydrolase [Longimicrobium sp.]|nr:glycosyl hydrolase [Longimicrobium sp.]
MQLSAVLRPRRAAVLAIAALLAACADVPTAADTPPDSAPAPATPPAASDAARPFFSGAFLGDANSTPERIGPAIAEFTERSGKHPSLVKTFHNLECDWSAGAWCGRLLRAVRTAGSTNFLAIDLRWTGAPEKGLLDAINGGAADARLTAMARGFAAFGDPVLLEPAWEMNGNWQYAWQGIENGADGNAPAKYRAAWRRIVDIFRREGATNVRWVFNPNVGNPVQAGGGTSHWNWYGNYYPGDAYVDYVGAHGFNAPRVWGGSWTGFAEMFDGARADHILSDLVSRYPGKPIIVGEFATDEGAGNAKAQWIGDAYRALLSHPNVVGAVWFNMNKEADWRIESSPAAQAAFRAAMAEPRIRVAFDVTASTALGSLAAR